LIGPCWAALHKLQIVLGSTVVAMEDAEDIPRTLSNLETIEVNKESTLSFDEGTETVTDRINKIGFGFYQVQGFILCSGFVIAEGAGLAMASGLANTIAEDLRLTPWGESMVMTTTFTGLATGTLITGSLADPFGRRLPMLVGYTGVVSSAVLISIMPSSPALLYVLLFAFGTFAGIGIPVAFIVLSEISPISLRGISSAAVGVAFSLGELWAGFGLWCFMPSLEGGPWHLMMLWAGIPALFFLVYGMLTRISKYDTVHWLAVNGQAEDLVGAVNLMAEVNGRPEFKLEAGKSLHSCAKGAHHHTGFAEEFAVLGQCPLLLFTIAQAILFFAKDFAFYGMGVFWPVAWEHVKGLSLMPASELCATALLGIPGVGIAMVLMYRFPRRRALAITAIVCGLAAGLLTTLESGNILGLIGVCLFKLFFPTWQMVTMLLPSEIFPTNVKGMGYSLVAVFGRFATILAPIIVGASRLKFLVACAGLAVCAAGFVSQLPETKDCGVHNQVVVNNEKDERRQERRQIKEDMRPSYRAVMMGKDKGQP